MLNEWSVYACCCQFADDNDQGQSILQVKSLLSFFYGFKLSEIEINDKWNMTSTNKENTTITVSGDKVKWKQ